MPKKYVKKTEGLNPKRGNDLYIFKDKLKMLHDTDHESAYRILCAFYDWTSGKRPPKLVGLEKSVLNALISDQIRRVKEYIKHCNNSGPKKKSESVKAGEGGIFRINRDYPGLIRNKHNEKEKEEDNYISTLSSSLGDNRARADAAPVTPLSLEAAKKELMLLAPPVDAVNYAQDDLDDFADVGTATEKEVIDAVMVMTDECRGSEAKRKFSFNTYRKLYREIGHAMFARAYMRFSVNLDRETQRYDPDNMPPDLSKFPTRSIARNPGAVFTKNLKRLSAAKSVLGDAG